MAAPPPPLPLTRATANDAVPDHQQQQGHGGAAVEVQRAAKALLFLAAVALPCLVLYHRAIVAPGDPLGSVSIPWRRGAARDDDAAADLDSEDASLERVLTAAAMPNDTVILTTLNCIDERRRAPLVQRCVPAALSASSREERTARRRKEPRLPQMNDRTN